MTGSSAPLELRSYQQECVDKVIEENTIVVLPTGAGKTLVAVHCIDRLRLQAREKNAPGCDRVMFVVPTVDLVDQQAAYCEKHCSSQPRVVRLSSAEKMAWDVNQWAACLEDFDILVGTPEIFSRALNKHAYISVEKFCFVVFDECHNAVGNHPMVAICKESIWPHMEQQRDSLRVAGFTASPSKASMTQKKDKMEQAIFLLQQNLQATIFAPIVPAEFQGVSAKQEDFTHIEIPAEHDSFGECGRFAEMWLQKLIRVADPDGNMKETSRALMRLRTVFDKLGRDGFCYALENSVIPQLQAKILQIRAYTQDQETEKQVEKLKEVEDLAEKLPELKELIKQEALKLDENAERDCSAWKTSPKHSAKVQKLISLLQELLPRAVLGEAEESQQKASDEQKLPVCRCLVLVHETMLPLPLSDILNHSLKVEGRTTIAGAVCGSNSMAADDRRAAIESFRQGEKLVLVSTPALEEGLDVPECNYLVRFDKFTTAKSHIQGAGRARHRDAKVFYFENCPATAQRAAKRMLSAATSGVIQPRDEDNAFVRQDHLSKRARSQGKHPYVGSGDGAEVTVFNCRDVVYSYGAKVLKSAFVAKDMYQWSEGESPRLLSVTYASPDGYKKVTAADVDAYWTGVDMTDIFDANRCKGYGMKDKEEMRCLFVIARQLREAQYIDKHNQPTVRAREMTKAKCEIKERSVPVGLTNKFPKTSSSQGVANPKGRLQEWCQRTWRGSPTDAMLKYETIEVPGGFRASVAILKLMLRFEGETKQNKKSAEHSAAEKALQDPKVG
eukprot:TRINITY_DN41278_c0_g1_i1.p1 TRINITY_DN41278_c0_g1~~TRINITY_DN41278_c0_g1_i1.p1  ORF type:complete len:786 (-),score=115.50 TRINITY_DN41278_c0_g1_i1:132-2489(-)